MNKKNFAIAMLIFKNPLYIIGGCLSAWTHRKFIKENGLNIKLIVMIDKTFYKYKEELEKYYDVVELIDIIELKLNQKYKIIDKYSDWMKFSASKWNIFKYDEYDKILFLDTDILPINSNFYDIFNFDTPSIMINGNNGIKNSIVNKNIFLSNIENISNNQYFYISTKFTHSLNGGILLIKPDKKIFYEYINFLKICEEKNGYISKYDSGIDETTLVLFLFFYKKIPVHLIPYEYIPIPWEKNPYNKNNVVGINFLSLIKPWIKLPMIQWADENIWHIIAKKAFEKHSIITKIYTEYLIDEIYNFYHNWQNNISKKNPPYNMEAIKSKKIDDITFELFNFLKSNEKNNFDINKIKHIMDFSTKIHKKMDKKLLIKIDSLIKIIGVNIRPNYQLQRNIINIKKITCDLNISNNFIFRKYKKIGIFNIGNKKYYLVKEQYVDKFKLGEYMFHLKFDKKIKKTVFENFILIPKVMIDCGNSIIYKYSELNYDFDIKKAKNIPIEILINHIIEICITLYYLNNILNIFHNDFIHRNNFNNIMINFNEKKIDVKIDKFNYSTNSNHIVLIDFEHSSPKPNFRTLFFYFNEYKKNTYKYRYISEVFIIYYYFYKICNDIEDYWDDNFTEIYKFFDKDTNSLKEFDLKIIKFLFDTKSKIYKTQNSINN